MHYICSKALARLILQQEHRLQIEPDPEHRPESERPSCSLDGDIEYNFVEKLVSNMDLKPVGHTPEVKPGDILCLVQPFKKNRRAQYEPRFTKITVL